MVLHRRIPPFRASKRLFVALFAVSAIVAGCGRGAESREPASIQRVRAPSNASRSEPAAVEAVRAPAPAPSGMAWIPLGRFSMGSDFPPFDDARPIHTVELDGFFIDIAPVTNAQFAHFVKE